MNEFELIDHLLPTLATNRSVVLPAGDDCAAVQTPGGRSLLLLKTDALVEGVHFTADTSPEQVGRKALARCLSDIAAMGGMPLHALVTLGLPPDFRVEYVESLYRGINTLARRYEMAVVGGETVRNPGGVFLSVAVLGKVASEKCVRRSGAKPGDALFVTGKLGGSLAGKHLEFEPRLAEAQWLVEHFSVHAMIDLSDGLAGDLRHILKASGTGAEVLASAIPISRAARLRSRQGVSRKTPLMAALTDGEDFELLFTVASAEAVRLLDGWRQQFPELLLSCIGKITQSPGLLLRTKEGVQSLSADGYVHFA